MEWKDGADLYREHPNMITLRPLGSTGRGIHTCTPASADPFGIDEVLDDGRAIGMCNRIDGAPLALTAIVSEAVIEDVLEVLDKRDGKEFGDRREVILSAHDPRRSKRRGTT